MKLKTRNLILIPLSLSALVACVPQRKLEEEQTKRNTAEKALFECNNKQIEAETKLNEQKNQLADNEKLISALKKDTTTLGLNYRITLAKYDKLSELNDKIQDKYSQLLAGNAQETKKLSGELQTTQESLLKKQDELKKLEQELNERKKDLDETKITLQQREARVIELETILKQKDEAVIALKKKVSDALLGFENKGLTISQRNGKVYVSLDESLLFASGSTVVEAKGIEALKKLAKVLEQNPDINVLVEGHTDDVPMKGSGEIKDNWDLSVMRATSIVKILVKNSNITPLRLTAAGHGEYMPLEASKSSEARKMNRRTEIILTPKLDELLKVLETN